MNLNIKYEGLTLCQRLTKHFGFLNRCSLKGKNMTLDLCKCSFINFGNLILIKF